MARPEQRSRVLRPAQDGQHVLDVAGFEKTLRPPNLTNGNAALREFDFEPPKRPNAEYRLRLFELGDFASGANLFGDVGGLIDFVAY